MDPWRDGRANGPSHLDFFGLQWRVSRVIFKLGRRATRTTRHHRAPAGPEDDSKSDFPHVHTPSAAAASQKFWPESGQPTRNATPTVDARVEGSL